MRNIWIGFAAICGFVPTLVAVSASANTWGPVDEAGNCTVDIGTRRETFECYIRISGEVETASIEIIRVVDGESNHNQLVGIYHARQYEDVEQVTFEWGDGTEEWVQASNFDNPGNWAFWTEGGCGIGFQRLVIKDL